MRTEKKLRRQTAKHLISLSCNRQKNRKSFSFLAKLTFFSFPLKTLAANSRKCEKRMAKNVNECPFSKLFSKWLNINFYGEKRTITHRTRRKSEKTR